MSYTNDVIRALWDSGTVFDQYDIDEEHLFVDVGFNGQTGTLMLHFEDNTLNVFSPIGKRFELNAKTLTLAYAAAVTANDQLFQGVGRFLVNIHDAESARFAYTASSSFLSDPDDLAQFVVRAAESLFLCEAFLSGFCNKANDGTLTCDDSLFFEAPEDNEETKITFHPLLNILLSGEDE